ncbi:class I SAM-dependent methyltransferase [Thermodesulfobacteriota bacterium]
MIKTCPVCNRMHCDVFFELRNVPVLCNLLLSSREDAVQCPKSDIRLAYCQICTHIFNEAFDFQKMNYTSKYDSSLHCSQHFQNYVISLVQRLTNRYGLREKHIIEIGCGQGDFLFMLCEQGYNTGTGFDPSVEPTSHSRRVKIIQDVYSKRYAGHADLLCCRHVLEHVENPVRFIDKLNSAIGPETIVYFEVPNVLYTLKDLGIWDIIYEHCLYFNTGSLGYLFASCGFRIEELAEAFDGQYLGIEAKKGNIEYKPLEIINYVKAFSKHYKQKINFWNREVLKYRNNVIWGAGSKGVTFLNTVDHNIKYIVDINPNKHGKYVPGTGQKIVAPEFLKEYRPETVILMNPLYKEEVRARLSDLGVTANILCA